MASDLIRLDKQGMEGVISQTKMAKENYDMAIQSLKRIIEGLNDVWVGEAQRGMYVRGSIDRSYKFRNLQIE